MGTAMTERRVATPDEIWAILTEAAEWRKEYERQAAEREAEHDRRQAEYEKLRAELTEQMRETDKQVNEMSRSLKSLGENFGGLSNTFGELTEHLLAPGLLRHFAAIGFHFHEFAGDRRLRLRDDEGEFLLEIDVYLENDDAIIAVEVKARPDANGKDIADHVRRIEKLKKYRDGKGLRPKRIMGAIAGAVFGENVKRAGRKAGFFVLEQSGDTMRLDIPEGFVPREW